MYQYKGFDDTICAIATPPGTGGIGIVRLSGADARGVVQRIFICGKQDPWQPFTVRLGWVKDKVSGENIDQALATFMQGPRSYTGEDVVELSCHGGPAILKAVLGSCLVSGARLAEPGEFTKRAFLNGRMDLAQAEAVLDVINADTAAFARASVHQLKGELSRELEAVREILMDAFTGFEALLNFPEEDTDAGQTGRLSGDIETALGRIRALLATARTGRVLREGVSIVICGRPNVGKSSLLNALLMEPRAIVTDVAGTTRDVIEETADMAGIPVRLIDTAGILTPRDKVEEKAVRRSRLAIESADVVLMVLDRSSEAESADKDLAAYLKDMNVVVVLNKSDLVPVLRLDQVGQIFSGKKAVAVSALQKIGLDDLREAVRTEVLGDAAGDGRGLVISNLRHVESLERAKDHLEHGQAALDERAPWEMISVDIKSAITCLDAITGRDIDADVVDRVFSRFCIGK